MSLVQAEMGRRPGPDAQAMMMFDSRKKSVAVAYVFWIFFCALGAHRFYAGRHRSALAMLLLSVLGWVTILLYFSFLVFGVVSIWALVDAFLIPGMIREYNSRLADELGGGSSLAMPRSVTVDEPDPAAAAQADAVIARYLARSSEREASPRHAEERQVVKSFGTRVRAP